MNIAENQILILEDNEYIRSDIIQYSAIKALKDTGSNEEDFDITICHNPHGFIATTEFLDRFLKIQNSAKRILVITDYAPFQNINTFADFSTLNSPKLNEGDEEVLKQKDKAVSFQQFIKENRNNVFIVLTTGYYINQSSSPVGITDKNGELTSFGKVYQDADMVTGKGSIYEYLKKGFEGFLTKHQI